MTRILEPQPLITKFTRRPGTTIVFTRSLPLSCSAQVSSARASRAALSACFEAFTRPRTNNYHSLLKYRPDLPAWLDVILSRATQPHAQDRFADVMEFAYELEDGQLRGAKSTPPHRLPIMQRNPLRFWQAVSLILAVILFTMLVLDR